MHLVNYRVCMVANWLQDVPRELPGVNGSQLFAAVIGYKSRELPGVAVNRLLL